MFWQIFISGFILGGISSFHCVGMCGPLALSLPLSRFPPLKKVLGILLYNFGRVVTYSSLGGLFGFVGRQIFIAGFQQTFSISVGGVIFFLFIMNLLHKKINRLKAIDKFYLKVQLLIAGFLRINTPGGFFLTGLANGFLPCGMVYLAITGAMAANNIWYGTEFMAAFGFGTAPALLVLSFAGFVISTQARSFIRKLTPYAFFLMSVLLILRGLNLGIPYLSPSFAANSKVIGCH
jgi:sulfite exporter TauE/SafE